MADLEVGKQYTITNNDLLISIYDNETGQIISKVIPEDNTITITRINNDPGEPVEAEFKYVIDGVEYDAKIDTKTTRAPGVNGPHVTLVKIAGGGRRKNRKVRKTKKTRKTMKSVKSRRSRR
jgi:hypothetical protein